MTKMGALIAKTIILPIKVIDPPSEKASNFPLIGVITKRLMQQITIDTNKKYKFLFINRFSSIKSPLFTIITLLYYNTIFL